MKPTFIAIVAVLLCLSVFSGCQTSQPNGTPEPPKTTAKKNETGARVSDPSDPNNVKIETAIRKRIKKPTGELTNIINPIVKKAIRKELRKPSDELTEADLEKVTRLDFRPGELHGNKWPGKQLNGVPKELEKLNQLTELNLGINKLTHVKGFPKLTQLKELRLAFNQLTELPKGLENLTQMTSLYLRDNPDLTKAQIDQLKKALPKCRFVSNPTK